MRKTYIYLFCLILFTSATQLKAQNCWSPLGSGVDTILNRGNAHFDYGYVAAMATYKGNLIVGGTFDSIGGLPIANIAAWDGTSWSGLGTGISVDARFGISTSVIALAVYNDELYAAGYFDSAGGVPANYIAKWNGTSWLAVGAQVPSSYFPTLTTMAVYNGYLYVGGLYDTIEGLPAQNIARWNGTTWSTVDGGIKSTGDGVECLSVYNGKLYAGGNFDSAGSVRAINIASWNDTSWFALGNGIGTNNYNIHSVVDYQGYLYAGGTFFSIDYSLDKWNGTTWSNVTGGINDSGSINSLSVFDNNLIVGGGFNNISGIAVSNLAQWNGTTWSSFGNGVSGVPDPNILDGIDVINTYNGYLYAGGYFTWAGSDSTSANSIAEYTCSTDGIHEVSADHVHVYPNPTTGMVNISIDNIQAGSSVQIYDLLGQRIYQSNISSDNTSINLSGHAAGTYIYHISGVNGEDISRGTLIIQ